MIWSKHVFTASSSGCGGSSINQCALSLVYPVVKNQQCSSASHSLLDVRFMSSICWLTHYSEDDWLIVLWWCSWKRQQTRSWEETTTCHCAAWVSAGNIQCCVVLLSPHTASGYILYMWAGQGHCPERWVRSVSSSSQTANEMDPQKESFGPPHWGSHSSSVLPNVCVRVCALESSVHKHTSNGNCGPFKVWTFCLDAIGLPGSMKCSTTKRGTHIKEHSARIKGQFTQNYQNHKQNKQTNKKKKNILTFPFGRDL